jgi:CTP synthase (UTP-ammonia lyase)
VHNFEEKGMKFVGKDVEGERMEIMELQGEFLSVFPCFTTVSDEMQLYIIT